MWQAFALKLQIKWHDERINNKARLEAGEQSSDKMVWNIDFLVMNSLFILEVYYQIY